MLVDKIIKKGNRKIAKLTHLNSYKFHVPPGHFYSPLISEDFVRQYEDRIFENRSKEIPAVDLNEEGQVKLLKQFQKYYDELPFTEEKQPNLRYALRNEYFDYSDGFFLHAMIRHYKPKRIVEVGSGFSSAMMLDTNDLFFENKIDLTFIEPNPERLKSNLKPGEEINLYDQNVQDVELDVFTQLEENDILFIDTSHVVKTGGELNYLVFNILPLLQKGVKIHIHDIFFPFEYPREWVIEQKRGWNETYFIRAFLMYNNAYKIIAFNSFLEFHYTDLLKERFPILLKQEAKSLWLTKE
ncbi:class I SAM-dependent methyltransferase [Nafulsella turpanensis]|uniref:class I SAM-dependent methyltransferase n=1 Tax=Nafulsella turpanensis TaxID=1265690 RepID=UPI00034602F1|nr:class I SAM-dependent methyltransferase [Nafulsella turpanensis]